MEKKEDHLFFRRAILSLSSSLDLRKAMKSTYRFFSEYFPLEGISLHVFKPESKAMHLLFFATDTDFFDVDKYVYLPEEGIQLLKEQEEKNEIVYIPHTDNSPAAIRTGKALAPYLPNKNRSRLIALLSSENKVIGHFSLIGPNPDAFTPEHKRKLASLRPTMSLLMLNMLQYQEIERLKNQLALENKHLSDQMRKLTKPDIIGRSGGLKQVITMVDQVCDQEVPVLITGETGTGKEIIADAIQIQSHRSSGPYIKVNCGAIPSTLIDSELFGHEKGAFTGAFMTKRGRFEQANGGTLFLDEIGDMPLEAQIRLLRVLQTGVIQRVGSVENKRVDVRVIAATHWDLKKSIEKGTFREDLFYRLNVFPIEIPPLRERKEDIVQLIDFFIKRKSKKMGITHPIKIDKSSMIPLFNHSWPGNVRELENMVERALVFDPSDPIRLHLYIPTRSQLERKQLDDPKITKFESNIPAISQQYAFDPNSHPNLPSFLKSTKQSYPSLDQAMADHIATALELCNGKLYGPKGAASLLKINANTLRKRMDKLGMSDDRFRQKSV